VLIPIRLAACVVGAAMLLAGCQNGVLTNPPDTSGDATTTSATRAPSHWTMPNLVGTNLQAAQDAIQKLTGDPVFLTASHDATGQRRHQILDTNWRVCSQNVAPGSTFTAKTRIDFGTVKAAEACP
jgi:hypothetical protein